MQYILKAHKHLRSLEAPFEVQCALHDCICVRFICLSALYTEIKQGTSAEEENVSIAPGQGMCFITVGVRRQLWPKKKSSSHHKSWQSLQVDSVHRLDEI